MANEQCHVVHDLIALGEVKKALSSQNYQANDIDEILRLPLLSRLLAASQLQASIPSIHDLDLPENSLSSLSSPPASEKLDESQEQQDLNEAVGILEGVAAAHPEAEGMDILTTFLVPEVCRKISKHLPLKRKRQKYSQKHHSWDGLSWNTTILKNTWADLDTSGGDGDIFHKGKKIKRVCKDNQEQIQVMEEEYDDDDADDGDDDDDADSENENNSKYPAKKKCKMSTDDTSTSLSHSSFLKASSMAGDSQESAIRKILIEITQLVLKSLDLTKDQLNYGQEVEAKQTEGKEGGELEIVEASEGKVPSDSNVEANPQSLEEEGGGATLGVKSDSLLAEQPSSSSKPSFSANDVSFILPALMHHCPILRYRHVANALCRAALPKTPEIIMSMAANNPTSIPSLLRGCVDAYQQALIYTADTMPSLVSIHAPILQTVKTSLKKIAKLSQKEALNVMNRLLEKRIMPDIFLKVGIENNENAVASAILEDFLNCKENEYSSEIAATTSVQTQSQSSGRKNHQQRQNGGQTLTQQKKQQQEHQSQPQNLFDGPAPQSLSKKTKFRRIRKKYSVSSSLKRPKTWFVSSMLQDANMAADARKCIFQCLFSALPTKDNDTDKIPHISWGQITLYLRAYSLLIAHVGVGSGSSIGSGSRFVEDSMLCLTQYAELLVRSSNNQIQKNRNFSEGDSFHRSALCACIITCSRFPPISDAKQFFFMGSSASTACFKCLSVLLKESVSKKSDVFAAQVAGFLASQDASELMNLIWKEMMRKENDDIEKETSGRVVRYSAVDDNAFFNTCRWTCSKIGLDELYKIRDRGVVEDAMLCDVSAVVDFIRRSQLSEDQLNLLISSLFNDAEKCNQIFFLDGVSSLIKEAVFMISQSSGIKIPIVKPRDLEAIAQRVYDSLTDSNELNLSMCRQFILQLLYAFEFLEEMPDSPFIIDPRVLPLQEALAHIQQEMKKRNDSSCSELRMYYSRLNKLILKWCPEITIYQYKASREFDQDLHMSPRFNLTSKNSHSKLKLSELRESLRKCIHNLGSDPSGCRAEALFIDARTQFLSSTVDTVTVCALLSSPKCPPPFYTHAALCKDPLVLFKCNVNVWRMQGTRRIVLSILQRLMEANTNYIHQTSQNETTTLELLSVRDLLILRCLIITASGSFIKDKKAGYYGGPSHCVMTIGLIRTMVAKRRGLVTMVIKQGIPERAIDWLVEFVPEVFLDARALTACIYERNSLTAAERLATADAGLRIAIAHGTRNETECIRLVYEALTCLVNSFPLVIGPVGVSVSVLCEEGGQDITQKCRRSTFRILKALQHISGKREALRNEASMALSKITTLCKSETAMGGVVGPAAMKRKAVLKEIWDAATRAANTVDNGLHLV